MVEGRGYCARRQERRGLKRMAEFIENRYKIIVVPDLTDKIEEMSERPKRRERVLLQKEDA